jgi:hypothetical protein
MRDLTLESSDTDSVYHHIESEPLMPISSTLHLPAPSQSTAAANGAGSQDKNSHHAPNKNACLEHSNTTQLLAGAQSNW